MDNKDNDMNPNDENPDNFNFDDQNPADTSASKRNTNFAITIVIVAGIILGAVLLINRPADDAVPPTAGAGTPVIIQPMATPPTQPVQSQPTVPSAQANPLQGINWQWLSVTDPTASQTTTVPNPGQYTVVFTADGFVNGIADCNSYTGTYSQDNGLTITVTTMTMAACPEGSLEQQYIQLLAGVVSGGPDGAGNLALETAGGAQRMLFQNGGPAR